VLLCVIESGMYSFCRGTAGFRVLITLRCSCSFGCCLYSSVSSIFRAAGLQGLLNRVIGEERIEGRK
jgi:hypothetical protein